MEIRRNKSKSMESLFRIRLKLPGSQCTFRASHASLRSCSFSTALMEFPIWYSSTFIFHNFKVYKLHVQLFLAKIVILFGLFFLFVLYSQILFYPDGRDDQYKHDFKGIFHPWDKSSGNKLEDD